MCFENDRQLLDKRQKWKKDKRVGQAAGRRGVAGVDHCDSSELCDYRHTNTQVTDTVPLTLNRGKKCLK